MVSREVPASRDRAGDHGSGNRATHGRRRHGHPPAFRSGRETMPPTSRTLTDCEVSRDEGRRMSDGGAAASLKGLAVKGDRRSGGQTVVLERSAQRWVCSATFRLGAAGNKGGRIMQLAYVSQIAKWVCSAVFCRRGCRGHPQARLHLPAAIRQMPQAGKLVGGTRQDRGNGFVPSLFVPGSQFPISDCRFPLADCGWLSAESAPSPSAFVPPGHRSRFRPSSRRDFRLRPAGFAGQVGGVGSAEEQAGLARRRLTAESCKGPMGLFREICGYGWFVAKTARRAPLPLLGEGEDFADVVGGDG